MAQGLALLLEKTGEEHWSGEARLLYDLQKACVDHEREVFALDPFGWLLSLGRKPLKRPLPNQRLVRIVRHLHSASQRLTFTRLSETDRQHLGHLLHKALHDNEERLRGRLRPLLIDAFQISGMQAANPPEQAALQKMVEELLDRVIELSFFTFSDLRDTISGNDLKQPDLSDPTEVVRGDSLLRLDRLLSLRLDSVYRPSEIYLRVIQRITSICFGTPVGRVLTRYLLLPFGLALAGLEAVDLAIHAFEKHLGGMDSGELVRPLFGPLSTLEGMIWKSRFVPSDYPWLAPTCWGMLSLVLIGLLYVPVVQQNVQQASTWVYQIGCTLLFDWVARLLPLPALLRWLQSWPARLIWALVLKPLPITFLICFFVPETRQIWWRAAGVFVLVTALVNTKVSRTLEEGLSRLLLRFLGWLHTDLLIGLVRLVIRVFKRVIDGLEYIFHSVDELLRVRAGDSSGSLVPRALLRLVWSPVSYLARLYVVVLIEPGFNPLKAPLSLVAAKFVYPASIALGFTEWVTQALEPVMTSWGARAFAFSTWWLLPDAVTFLIWETKENWKLFRANRRVRLGPISIGPHGETLGQLLRPGFHSGRLPKLYGQWRRAERALEKGGAGTAARACREKLQRLGQSLSRFVERDVLALLEQCPGWVRPTLQLGAIRLASNLVRIELVHADFHGLTVRLAIAEEGRRLVAHMEDLGWARLLPPVRLVTLGWAIAGLYKFAGVDLVREQVQACLPAGALWTIRDGALVVRFDPDSPEITYNLNQEKVLHAQPGDALVPALDPECILFARTPILWRTWVDGWQHDGSEIEVFVTSLLFPSLVHKELEDSHGASGAPSACAGDGREAMP